jgi:uncharacterized membrane protein YgcG
MEGSSYYMQRALCCNNLLKLDIIVVLSVGLQGKTAQAALQEARGFTATVPTTELIRGKKQGSSSSAAGSPSSGSRGSSGKGLPSR